MIKFISIFILSLLGNSILLSAIGQSINPYEAILPLFEADREVGELKVIVQEEKLIKVYKDSLIKKSCSSVKN